jgi:hypothetical protein
MVRRPLYTRLAISAILILQVIPLLLFPPSVFGGNSQMLWLPALLVVMVVLGDVQLFVRPSTSPAPWYLLSFAQGVNIISRLMMLWANSSTAQGQTVLLNWSYILLNVVAMAMSMWLLLYLEKPQVREGLLPA